jgi:hypothetical protein
MKKFYSIGLAIKEGVESITLSSISRKLVFVTSGEGLDVNNGGWILLKILSNGSQYLIGFLGPKRIGPKVIGF